MREIRKKDIEDKFESCGIKISLILCKPKFDYTGHFFMFGKDIYSQCILNHFVF